MAIFSLDKQRERVKWNYMAVGPGQGPEIPLPQTPDQATTAPKQDTVSQWFEAVYPGGTKKGNPSAETADPKKDTIKEIYEGVYPPVKEQPQLGEKLQRAVDHLLKPGPDLTDFFGDPDGKREAYLKQFTSKDADSILQDSTLTEEQKFDKLEALRRDVMGGATAAQRDQLVAPDRYIDRMQGYMEANGQDKQTIKDRSVLLLKGYMGGALALNHVVRAVWAASEIGRISGSRVDQTMEEYGQLFSDLRQKFEENRDGNSTRFLDSMIKDKFGYEWGMQTDGGKVTQSYRLPPTK